MTLNILISLLGAWSTFEVSYFKKIGPVKSSALTTLIFVVALNIINNLLVFFLKRKENDLGSVIWISGISASGKTTLGEMLSKSLENMGYGNIIFLDGEVLRNRLKNKYGHSIKERYKIDTGQYKP